jgi:4-amino-4-deoxy-L-arabinose transferase-like glycosyltransferase
MRISLLGKRLSLRALCLIGVGALSLIGGGMAIYSSANGPWGYQDAATYIITARNFLRGIGLGYFSPNGSFHVWTLKPPVYSVLLGLIGRFGIDLVAASRWSSILLFAAIVFLGGLTLVQFGGSVELSLPTACLLLVFPTMVRMAGSAMSEPLFVFLLLASIFCLLGTFQRRSGLWLILAAVATGLLPMTRYIGIAMIPVGVIGILIFFPGSWWQRFWRAALFGIIASLPILVWEGWVYLRVDHSLAGRTVALDWGTMSAQLVQFYLPATRYVMSWVPLGDRFLTLRFRVRYGLILLGLVVLVVATLLATRRSGRTMHGMRADGDLQLFAIAGLWLVAYLLFLAIDAVIANPVPPIDNRIMLPFYAGLVLWLIAAVACWKKAWFEGDRRWLNLVPWAIALGLCLWYLPVTIDQVMIPYHAGIGQTAYTWKSSETMAAVRQLPRGTVLITNDSYAVWVWADRSAYDLIDDSSPTFILKSSAPYGSSITDPDQAAFRKPGADLVIFDQEFPGQLKDRFGEQDPARAKTLVQGLVLSGEYADGAIYTFPR